MGAKSCRNGGGARSRPRRAPRGHPLFRKQMTHFRRLLATGSLLGREGAQKGETFRYREHCLQRPSCRARPDNEVL